jgi:hypothetical protein
MHGATTTTTKIKIKKKQKDVWDKEKTCSSGTMGKCYVTR